jgi:uncharacterized protein involved in outer membrane biogenesis
MSRTKIAIRLLLASAALAVTAVLVGLVPINIALFSDTISRSVYKATGLELTLGGSVALRLGPRASLSVSDLALATPDGSRLLALDTARVRVALLALVRGHIHVHRAEFSGLWADFCQPSPERPEASSSEEGEPLEISVDLMRVTSAELECNGEPAGLRIQELDFSAPDGGATRLELTAILGEVPAKLTANGGDLDTLLRGELYKIDARLDLEHASLSVDGRVAPTGGRPDFDARIELNVADMLALGGAFELDVPDLGAIDVAGELSGDLAAIDIGDLSGSAGNTRFAASGSLALAGERPSIELDASLLQLDLEPLLADSEPADDGAADLAPLIESLQEFDADLHVTIDSASGLPLEIRSVTLDATLVDGVVELNPAYAEVLDGRLSLTGRFDSAVGCPAVELQALLESSDLERLKDAGWLAAPVSGQVDRIEVELGSCGTTVQEHIHSLIAAATASGGNLLIAGETPVDIRTLAVSAAEGEPVRANASARLSGETIEANAIAGSLQAILDTDTWPVRLDMRAGGGVLSLEGEVHGDAGRQIFAGRAELRVAAVGSLQPWFDVSPDTDTPLAATANLAADASRIRADDIQLKLGRSDLAGTAEWHYAESPSALALELRSNYVDLEEIGGLFERSGPSEPPTPNPSASPVLPAIDLNLFFAVIRDGPLDIEDLEIQGRMRAGLIDNARVRAIVEDELKLEGEIDIDATKLPATLELELAADGANLGRLLRKLELADDLAMRAEHVWLRAKSTGMSVREMLKNTGVRTEVRDFEWDISRAGSDDDFEVRLGTLTVLMLPGLPLGASTYGTVAGQQVEMLLETPGLAALLGETDTLPLRIIAAVGADVALLDAELDRSADGVTGGYIELSGQAIEPERRVLSELSPPLTDYVLRGDLELLERDVSLTNLKARLGGSTATGSASIVGAGRQRVVVDIESPLFQADDLNYLPNIVQNSADSDVAAAIPPDRTEENSQADARGPLLLLNDLVIRYQEHFDLELSAAIDELYSGEDLVGGAEVGFYIDEDELRLQPVTIRLPGGSLDAEYAWRAENGRVIAELATRADGFLYGGLLRLVDSTSEARGVVYFDVDFAANADWKPGVSELDLLLENANGTIDLAAWPENFETGVLDLWTSNLIFAVLPTPTVGDVSRLNCLVARLEATDGLLKTKNVLVDSTGTVIRGRGSIDLAQGQINLLVTPQAKRERFFSASTPVRVTGPLNDFEVGVEPAGFIGTLLRWYTSLIYVPFKWLTGQRFPPDGTQTCFDMMDWELTPALEAYFSEHDFSAPPPDSNSAAPQ